MKVGIDLGGSHIAIGIVDTDGRIIEKMEKRLRGIGKQDIMKTIEEIIVHKITQFMKQYNIEEIGMAIPGMAKDGVIISSGNIGVENYPIEQNLKKRINLPIKIRNDAKCAAIAEHTYGCLKGFNKSLFITLGTGIGGAVFYDNKLLEGFKKPGYEIGHMVIEKNGIPCNCGRKGCFERYASMKALRDNLRSVLGVDGTVSSEQLLDIIRKNKPENKNYKMIEDIISEYIENLSIGILNLINIFEPEIIGIGGSFVYFEDVLLPRIKEKIQREDIIIESAVLGNDAGIIGATCAEI